MNKRIRKKKERGAPRALALVERLTATKQEPVEGMNCPGCQQATLIRTSALMWGPYGGSVECPCGYKGSFMGVLGRNLVAVRPLTDEETANRTI
jgi:hypothetical protein